MHAGVYTEYMATTTTLRVSKENRDALARIAKSELDGASLDEALKTLLFERRVARDMARLRANPEELADYRREAREVVEADVEVRE